MNLFKKVILLNFFESHYRNFILVIIETIITDNFILNIIYLFSLILKQFYDVKAIF